MHVIGTAGHVDHGKSALVAALTGMHPDRLKEEISREMSIDLGFAWMDLPNGKSVGIVDVPGHRDFIENMLAGVGGIDATLFVIAANEGIMPQTREHLAILDLLQINAGIIALNKVDLIDDPEWLDLIQLDIREAVMGTVLQDAPIIRVSAKTKQGLDELLASLQQILQTKATRPDLGRPRLPVDRVFSLSGFGTIVTGTLLDGRFHIGDEVLILPEGLKGRIRGLQGHKQKVEIALPGSRTAINISGVNKKDIHRGDVITRPDDYQPSHLIDLHFRLLSNVNDHLKHNTQVKLFIGAAEVQAQLRLLGINELEPGKDGFIQLKLKQPVVAVRGDRYIIRRPSPGETLGGGIVLDPHPEKIHRRFSQSTLDQLTEILKGDPTEILLQTITRLKAPTVVELMEITSMFVEDIQQLVSKLLSEKVLISLNDDKFLAQQRLMTMDTWQSINNRLLSLLKAFHQANPLKLGMPRETVKVKMDLPAGLFDLIAQKLAAEENLNLSGTTMALGSHTITLTQDQETATQVFLKRCGLHPYSPPGYKEGQEQLGEDLLQALIITNRLVFLSDGIIYTPEAYQSMVKMVKERLHQNGTITLAEVRDQFQTSRKYVLALLEHLDAIGLTVRQGDIRVLKHNNH